MDAMYFGFKVYLIIWVFLIILIGWLWGHAKLAKQQLKIGMDEPRSRIREWLTWSRIGLVITASAFIAWTVMGLGMLHLR